MNVNNTTTTNAAEKADAVHPADAYGRIAQLAWEATSHSAYFAQALACVGRALGARFVAVEANLSSQVVRENYHSGADDPGFWKSGVDDLLTESLSGGASLTRLYRAKDGEVRYALLSAVFAAGEGAVGGVVVAAVPCVSEAQAAGWREVLKSLAALMGVCAAKIGSGGQEASQANLGQVVGRAAQYRSQQEMAFAMTNNLRNKTGCEQVALGLVNGRRVRVVSISGFDEVKKRTPGVDCIRSAMEECLDHGGPVASAAGSTDGADYPLHRQWRAEAGGDSVASVPLFVGESCAAVLSLRRSGDQPFESSQLAAFGESIAPYATALTLVDRATRGLLPHMAGVARAACRELLTGRRWVRKAAAAAVAIAAGWVAFGTIPYAVTAPCVVAPAEMRTFSAPCSAQLGHVAAVAGDRVRAGDLLCELDSTDLRVERARLAAEIEGARIDGAQAAAAGDAVGARLAAATAAKLQALATLVDRQIERLTIRAEFDGVVLAGDLRPRVGQVLAQGEPLLQVAAERGWMVRLQAPEAVAASIAPDLAGRFVSNAMPGETQPLRVVRVHPRAEAGEGENAYLVEARLAGDAAWMRAGMEGVAKVEVGRRPVWWVLSHRLINYLRLKLWL